MGEEGNWCSRLEESSIEVNIDSEVRLVLTGSENPVRQICLYDDDVMVDGNRLRYEDPLRIR
jgi:hypothetical protein